MKTTKEMTEIMLAFERGEQIEKKYVRKWFYDEKWHDVPTPKWDWVHCDYRIKQKPKYVPFDTPDEFLEAQRVHGEVLEDKENGDKMTAYVNKNGIVACAKIFSNTWMVYSLQNILRDYRFKDGTPCGKIID